MDTRVRVEIISSDDNRFEYRFCSDPVKGNLNKDYTIVRDIFKRANGLEVKANSSASVGTESYDSYEDNKRYIWAVLYPLGRFLEGQRNSKGVDTPFSQDLLLTESVKSKMMNEPSTKQIPILHLIPTSLFLDTLYGSAPLSEYVPRCFQIMDSSIWNYFGFLFNVTFDYESERKEEVDWKLLLRRAIKSICINYEKHLYDLSVAQEYADLNARIVNESFLSGSHAVGVSPFIFHSESVIKHLIKKEFSLDAPIIERIKSRRWRILLVDDKAVAPMENNLGDDSPRSWNCRLTIIKQLLIKQFGLNNGRNVRQDIIPDRHFNDIKMVGNAMSIGEDAPFVIEYAETEEDAEKALKSKKYDIILLDYLLKDNTGNHYGYELLEDISRYAKDSKYKKGMGPNGKFFFLFISAYSSAIYERLLAEGLNQIEDYWQIAIGSCPTNTPQLFLYNLIKLMEIRLEHSGIDKLSAKRIYKLVESIYHPEEGSVRKNANNKYQDVLSLQYHYRKMLADVDIPEGDSIFDTKGSVLITDFVRKNVNLGGMLEHLNQLVHLTAFGTIRQWPEMWEEFIYFKGQFKAQNDIAGSEAVTDVEYHDMVSHIENYIKTLKMQ